MLITCNTKEPCVFLGVYVTVLNTVGYCNTMVITIILYFFIIIYYNIIILMRWAGHVARMGEERRCVGSCWENRKEGDH